MHKGETEVYVTGVGQSDIYRIPGRNPQALAIDACKAAIADAGLKLEDIDGLSSWPGFSDGGFSPTPMSVIKNAFGLKLNWYSAGWDGAGQYASILNAIGAISAGFATHVLCFRSLGERSAARNRYSTEAGDETTRVTDWRAWLSPYWSISAANWLALNATLHMHKYDITREQMSAIPITQRANAGLNPKAIYREPMTLNDYMNARMISSPFCLFDCDVPIDGATAVVLSRKDVTKDLPNNNIRFEAIGGAIHDTWSWTDRSDFPKMAMHDAGKAMWLRTDLKPKDVQVAGIYDGFTYLTMQWLEALQFCDEGGSGAFIEGGTRISCDGELPLNTHGGQLSEGRMHSYNFIHENILQMRGEAGKRQLHSQPEVAVCAAGGGPLGGCFLLVKDQA